MIAYNSSHKAKRPQERASAGGNTKSSGRETVEMGRSLPPPESPYAKLTATLVAETLLADREPDLIAVLTRYIELHGFTSIEHLKDDMLWGAEAIAAFLGRNAKTVFLWVESGRFPCSRLGKNGIAARKSIIVCWMLTQELMALRGAERKSAPPPHFK